MYNQVTADISLEAEFWTLLARIIWTAEVPTVEWEERFAREPSLWGVFGTPGISGIFVQFVIWVISAVSFWFSSYTCSYTGTGLVSRRELPRINSGVYSWSTGHHTRMEHSIYCIIYCTSMWFQIIPFHSRSFLFDDCLLDVTDLFSFSVFSCFYSVDMNHMYYSHTEANRLQYSRVWFARRRNKTLS